MSLKMELVSRFFKEPAQSYFLLGPRGTGKSTWVQQHHPQALKIDLLFPEVYRSFLARPELLRESVLANLKKKTVFIDEVQKVPDLLSVVHQLLEEKLGLHFILSGSSARKLKRTGTNLLAGRALMRTLHPFMAAELGECFHLATALRDGLLPVVFSSEKPSDSLQAYAALYLREEILAESLVRNIGNFSRFLESIAFSHGGVLNISNVARECQIERKVAEGYVGILEDLLLAFRLPVFSKRVKRAVSSHPKFYYFDAGVFRTFRLSGPLDRPEEIDGAALEGLVAQHLKAWISYSEMGGSERLYFWRSRAGTEVDFVVYGAHEFCAIEVKNSAKVRSEDLRPLLAFVEDFPESQALLLYRGKQRLKQKGILCMPCEDFLKNLRPNGKIWDATEQVI